MIQCHMQAATKYHVSPWSDEYQLLARRVYPASAIASTRQELESMLTIDLGRLPQIKDKVEHVVFEADYYEAPRDVLDMARLLSSRLQTAEALVSLGPVLAPYQTL